ncbi:MAG: glutamate--tRNA ligase [Gammaproteobacteria bacterium]|nr:glutamate--tRNA ligase [Gammaproteobacteria bacterium]MDE0248985.1 glutamate--tRNA ligase [Gammaproteobacteria bacterium]
MPPRVRFAPSPTGHLHVGGARTALFNWLFARHSGGTFVLRIEDTDRERSSPAMVQRILEGLEWLGLDWDEGPFFQSEGVGRHRADAESLLARGLAYRDFVPPDELRAVREERPDEVRRYPRLRADALDPGEVERRAERAEPHAIRFRVPPGETAWDDLVHGRRRFRNDDIEDLVILRSDGTPTYNLAVASDDAEMRITHVIRGDDHLANTPKQILLLRALGKNVPRYGHVPMILAPGGKRISKRHGAAPVSAHQRNGILAEAMVNFLALLGWSPGTDEEVMTRGELIEQFSLDRVVRKSAVFDAKKLAWLSGQHLARLPEDALAGLVLAELGDHRAEGERRRREDPGWFSDLLDLLRRRGRTPAEVASQMCLFLTRDVEIDPRAAKKHWGRDPALTRDLLSQLAERFSSVPWVKAKLEAVLRALAVERGIAPGRIIHPLRVALTGSSASPGIFDVLRLLGPDTALARIRTAVDLLEDPDRYRAPPRPTGSGADGRRGTPRVRSSGRATGVVAGTEVADRAPHFETRRPEDNRWMSRALKRAREALAKGEVPVGAVLIKDGGVLAEGFNMRILESDPTAHAEVVAIRRGAKRLGDWRLEGATLYTTLEPCAQCAGALVLARVERLVYGASDPKGGMAGSLGNLVQDPRLNHRVRVTRGVLEEACSGLLQKFFRDRRSRSSGGRVPDADAEPAE